MPHKPGQQDWDDYDAYDDYDDYYDDDYYEEEESKTHAPPSSSDSALVDFIGSGSPLDAHSEVAVMFISKVHDLLGPSSYSEKDVVDILNKHNGDCDAAMTSLLEQSASREASKTVNSIPLPTPPTSRSSEKIKPPVAPVPKRVQGIGVSVSGVGHVMKNGSKQQHKIDGKVKVASSTPPLRPKSRGGSRTSSPAIAGAGTKKSPPLSLSRSGSKNSLTTSSSSGQLNRMAPLSDDEMEHEDAFSSAVTRLTIVVAGHVDAGKSTLVGHFLQKLGAGVTQRQLHNFEKKAGESGKSSFYLAWVMDESESEREHGVTIGLAERYFRTKNYDFTVLDAPGHRDFIPTMINGANQADVAMLVIPATPGEFESSMNENAQTREHAVLLKALGVNQVIVVINKMDMTDPPWCKDRYAYIQSEMRTLLTSLQFGPKAIRFVPVSSLNGINLNPLTESFVSASASIGKSSTEKKSLNTISYAKGVPCPELFKWYIGPSLVELLDTFKQPPRHINKPLRATITSVVSESSKGFEVRVKVLQGCLRRRRGVGISLIQGVFDVKKINKEDGTSCDSIPAGEEAALFLVDRSSRSTEEVRLREGLILYKGPPYPLICTVFKATILTFNPLIPPIIPGSSYELYLHGEEHLCNIRKLYSMTSSKDGVIKKPKCIPGDRSASVKIEVSSPISLETFNECRSLGRFALRSKGRTCAVGICDSVKGMKVANAGSTDKKAS